MDAFWNLLSGIPWFASIAICAIVCGAVVCCFLTARRSWRESGINRQERVPMCTTTCHSTWPRVLLITLATPFVFGPLACNPGYTTSSRGVRIDDDTVAALKPGNTDKDWVLAVLGPPTRKQSSGADAPERWIWLHEQTRRAHRLGAPTEHYRRTVTVEFDGDTLLRAWSKESND